MKIKILATLIIHISLCLVFLPAQITISMEEAMQIARENNLGLDVFRQSVEQQNALLDAQVPANKTSIFYGYDKNNIAENGSPLHVLGVGQVFKWPSIYNHYKQAQQSKIIIQEQVLTLEELKLSREVEKVFENHAYVVHKRSFLQRLDSIYSDYLNKANRNLELGGGTLMESLTARQKIESLSLDLKGLDQRIIEIQSQLKLLLQTETNYIPGFADYGVYQKKIPEPDSSLVLKIGEKEISSHELFSEARYSDRLPDFHVDLFSGMNSFDDLVLYPGFQVGVSVALSQGYYKARKRADQIQTDILKTKLNEIRLSLNYKKNMLEQKLQNQTDGIELYKSLESTAEQLISTAKKALDGGEINYFQYLSTLDEALQVKMKKIELIHQYNLDIIEYNYLLND